MRDNLEILLDKSFIKKTSFLIRYINLDLMRIIESEGIIKTLYEPKDKEIIGLCALDFTETGANISHFFAPNLYLKKRLFLETLTEIKDYNETIKLYIPHNDEELENLLIKSQEKEDEFLGFRFKRTYSIILFVKEGGEWHYIPKVTNLRFKIQKLKEKVKNYFSNFLFALVGTKTVGVLSYTQFKKENNSSFDQPLIENTESISYIQSLYVEENTRRRGVATALLHYLLNELKNEFLVAEVPLGNIAALRLFSKANFGIVGSYKILIGKKK